MDPDAMIKEFRTLLDNVQDATHGVAIFSGTQECIRNKCRNKMYRLDEQLHPMEFCIYHAIMVHMECLEGEHISQMCQCTESQCWHRGVRPNNPVWIKQSRGRCYGARNGRLPWQLQWLTRIKLLNKDGAVVEYWLTLAPTTTPENSGYLDPVSKFV